MPFKKITVDSNAHTGSPLLFMYDCEITGGRFYQDHIMEIGSAVIAPDGVSTSNHEVSSLCHTSYHVVCKGLIVVYQPLFFIVIAIIVSENCEITACDLYNQANFSTVLKNFIKWIQECLQEAQQEQDYYPLLLSHNGFAFDFPFIVAEVKCCKLDDDFNLLNLSFADTLYDARRLVKEEHSIFSGWVGQEKKKLELENLFHKCFPGETYNAHRALEDVCAMKRIFSSDLLYPLLSNPTIQSKSNMVAYWQMLHHERIVSQQFIIHFGTACTKTMAKHLNEYIVSHTKC